AAPAGDGRPRGGRARPPLAGGKAGHRPDARPALARGAGDDRAPRPRGVRARLRVAVDVVASDAEALRAHPLLAGRLLLLRRGPHAVGRLQASLRRLPALLCRARDRLLCGILRTDPAGHPERKTMCGIFGVVSPGPLGAAELVKASRILRHRGPDDEGFL